MLADLAPRSSTLKVLIHRIESLVLEGDTDLGCRM